MKKLISIKSDESGEHIYFTHKKGVDSIKKSEVVDLELLNTYKGNKSLSEEYEITLAIALFLLWMGSIKESMMPMLFFSFFSLIIVFLTLEGTTRNTRNKLKIYTLSGTFEYKMEYQALLYPLYEHFKILLSKYLPSKVENLFFDMHKSKRTFFKVMTFVLPCLIIVSMKLSFESSKGYLIWNIITSVVWTLIAYAFYLEGYRSKIINYSLQGNHFKLTTTVYTSNKRVEKVYLKDIRIVENLNRVAIIPKLWYTEEIRGKKIEDEHEYIEHYKYTTIDRFHSLKIAQDYRDITPIIVRYINDLSDEQAMDESLLND